MPPRRSNICKATSISQIPCVMMCQVNEVFYTNAYKGCTSGMKVSSRLQWAASTLRIGI